MPFRVDRVTNINDKKFIKDLINYSKWLQICYQGIESNVKLNVMHSIEATFEEAIVK